MSLRTRTLMEESSPWISSCTSQGSSSFLMNIASVCGLRSITCAVAFPPIQELLKGVFLPQLSLGVLLEVQYYSSLPQCCSSCFSSDSSIVKTGYPETWTFLTMCNPLTTGNLQIQKFNPYSRSHISPTLPTQNNHTNHTNLPIRQVSAILSVHL